MADTFLSAADLANRLKARSVALGFDLIGITHAARPETLGHLERWLREGYHGAMEYLPRRKQAYEHPEGVLQRVRSLIVAAINYGPGLTPATARPEPGCGRVAAYAQSAGDYHDVLREKLRALADVIHEHRPAARTRVCVDTAPLLERDVAQRAGLGWFGKNTMLINKRQGSYFFLGAVLTDEPLPADAPHETSHCGSCTRCLDACPTDAFPAPCVLDATRCISYLTIELRDQPMPEELREGVGDWLFGCDVCQQVCPWNRKARVPTGGPLAPAEEQAALAAAELLELSEEGFAARFGATPLSRPGRAGLARNAAVVLGNTGHAAHLPALQRALDDPATEVRETARWAIEAIQARI